MGKGHEKCAELLSSDEKALRNAGGFLCGPGLHPEQVTEALLSDLLLHVRHSAR